MRSLKHLNYAHSGYLTSGVFREDYTVIITVEHGI